MDTLTQQTEHRRTDHDRHSGGPNAQTGVRDFGNMGAQDMSNHGGAMDIDKEMASLSNYESSLESLQKEFTSAFHLCKSCKSSPIPILGAAVADFVMHSGPSLLKIKIC
jgi:hypothetical protein